MCKCFSQIGMIQAQIQWLAPLWGPEFQRSIAEQVDKVQAVLSSHRCEKKCTLTWVNLSAVNSKESFVKTLALAGPGLALAGPGLALAGPGRGDKTDDKTDDMEDDEFCTPPGTPRR